jgi:RHS repeat-associated protein
VASAAGVFCSALFTDAVADTGDRRLQEIHHKRPDGGTLSRFAYTYDAVGNIDSWTQQYEATTRAYDFSYDAADQLTGAVYRTTDPTPTVLTRYGYTYDPAGNRTTEQIDDAPRSWTYDALNRLMTQAGGGLLTFTGTVSEPASVTIQSRPAAVTGANAFTGSAVVGLGTNVVDVTATDASGNAATASYEVDVDAASETFAYDANGNLATRIENGSTWQYTWSVENQLVNVMKDNVEVARFAYDALGRRAEKAGGVVTSTYVYDGHDIIREARTNGVSYRYGHGPRIDQPLSRVDQSGTRTYYYADGLGTVIGVTDTDSTTNETRRYDAWGNLHPPSTASGYAFTGREWDSEIGLYYYRARYYDPKVGRFLSEDPLGLTDNVNLYAYVGNRPTSLRDPLGLYSVDEGLYDAAQFATGIADSLSLGLGPIAREALGIGGVDRCSTAYRAGGWASFALGASRMAYAGLAKAGSMAASSGVAASAFRSQLRNVFRLGVGKNLRPPNLSKYPTDEALRGAAGRTNPLVNAYGAGMTAVGGAAGVGCGCSQ